MYYTNNEQRFDGEELSINSSFIDLDLQSLFHVDENTKNGDNLSTINFSNNLNDIDKSITEPSKQEKKSETKLRMENLFDNNNLITFENEYQRDYFKVFRPNNPRGRKTKRGRKNKSPHDKYQKDNIIRKVKVHSINYIINLVNFVLIILGLDFKFRKISYDFKKKIKIKDILLLKKMAIKEIICQQLSPKFKIDKKNDNTIIFESVKNNPIIKNLLYTNYLEVFKKLYYFDRERKINLKDYGSDSDLIYNIPKGIETFEDLLRKNKNDCIYKKLLIEYVKNNFLKD